MASDVTAELRAEVALRAGYRCEYCGIHEDDAGFAHQVDQIRGAPRLTNGFSKEFENY